MRYCIQIDGVEVESGDTKVYSEWEDTYYKSVMLNDAYPVKAEGRINIKVWIAKNMNNRETLYTWSGTEGDSYANVENEHKGLFRIDSGEGGENGTYVGSGQVPGIYYFMD